MRPSSVYVISDLHLGGDPEADGQHGRGFKMCHQGPLLAEFIRAIAAKDPTRERSELVINGDFIDFLAERPVETPDRWAPFHENPEHARVLFHRIAGSPDKPDDGREPAVFDALGELVTRGHRLTVLLGNHDIELALPLVRAAFLERVGAGPGRRVDVEMIMDNRAYVIGDVIIEHGNQEDAWNRVDYDGLRAMGAVHSRRRTDRTAFEPPAGSLLVAEVINGLKAELPFVDLLKPEGRAVVPVLLALKPSVLPTLRAVLELRAKAARAPLEKAWNTARTGHGYEIAKDESEHAPRQDPIVAAIRDTLPEDDADELLKIVFDQQGGGEIAGGVTKLELWLAFKLLRWFYRDEVFDVSREHGKPYRKAAARLVQAGFGAVIFGHTHLAVCETIEKDGCRGTYLNTGTWADLVRVPSGIGDVLMDDNARGDALDDARSELAVFLAAMRGPGLEDYIRRRPTFARIRVSDSGPATAELCEFQSGADPATLEPIDA